MGRWSRRARNLGGSLVEVLQAEIHSLLADFQRTGQGAVKALLMLIAAAAFGFWTLGLFLTFAVGLLATRMTFWQAAGLVCLAVGLCGFGVAVLARNAFRRLDAPTRIVRTHVDGHVEWWRETLSPPEQVEDGSGSGEAR